MRYVNNNPNRKERVMDNNAYIENVNSLTVFVEGQIFNINADHVNYEEILGACEDGDWEIVSDLADQTKAVEEWDEDISVKDGVIFFGDTELHNSLTSRILSMIQQDKDATALVNFLSNLLKNPSNRSIMELYDFLAVSNLPITSDGYFLAYKSVGSDYMDRHSGKNRHHIGDVVSMPRNMVDDDKDRTCSRGLHFCSLSYLRGFWGFGGHTMILKINPADVVSIPADYDNAKGRCCKYEVLAEYGNEDKGEWTEESVVETALDASNRPDYYDKRGPDGRFIRS
jgi:hypothetical protein